jgi:hypothetical protein
MRTRGPLKTGASFQRCTPGMKAILIMASLCLYILKMWLQGAAFFEFRRFVIKKKRRVDFDIATGMNYGVASYLSWSRFLYNSETDITRIEGPPKITAPFKGEHLEWAWTSRPAPISTHKIDMWLKISDSPGFPHHDWVNHRW